VRGDDLLPAGLRTGHRVPGTGLRGRDFREFWISGTGGFDPLRLS
jgi:hypothetical protein